jgi:MoaA/NifB/PqqE/SkfB family radical SAM enzyme
MNISIFLFNNFWLSPALEFCLQAKKIAKSDEEITKCKALELDIRNSINEGYVDFSKTDKIISINNGSILSTLSFQYIDNENIKKSLFKQSVTYINVETSSQCNRKCQYCPNSFNDRFTTNKFMDKTVYTNLLLQLAEINYSNTLNFVGYNEPLMHREDILANIKLARKLLPNADLTIFTNGDYLNKDYLQDLCDAGLSTLRISVHDSPGSKYDQIAVIDRIYRLSRKLERPPLLEVFNKNTYVRFKLLHQKMNITIFQNDYDNYGNNRGGVLDDIGQSTEYKRISACNFPLYHFIIGYEGKVVPCCVMVPDENVQNNFVGDISKSSIFDVYAGKNYVDWRRSTLNLSPKTGPCANCNEDSEVACNKDATIYNKINTYREESRLW